MASRENREEAAVIQIYEGTNEIKSANEYSRSLLFSYLDSLDGEKTIVWDRDDSLVQRVDLFVGISKLKAHGVVTNHKIVASLEKNLTVSTPHVVFFLTPTKSALDDLCKYIDSVPNNPKTLYQVCFIPEAWYVIREKLKSESDGKYWERLESVKEIPLCWLPRDGECLSLSNAQFASRLLINEDWTHLHKCAVAMNQIIDMCRGNSSSSSPSHRPITVLSKGEWASKVATLMKKVRNSTEIDNLPKNSEPIEGLSKINRIVLIDRWLDPLTPMLSQLTFSGLLDEIYGVGMKNSVEIPDSEFENQKEANSDEKSKKEIKLNDEVYTRLKHWHINGLTNEYSKILKEIEVDEKYDRENYSVAEYYVLAKKMPKILHLKKMMGIHIRLAELIQGIVFCKQSDYIRVERDMLNNSDGDKPIPFIEDQIFEAVPLNGVLRLISVHSLSSDGLKPSVLQHYRRIVNQSYGSSALNKVLKMQKMGLIREKGGGKKMQCDYAPMMFQEMKKTYDLVPEVFSESKLDDLAYAFSGYVPPLCKMLEEGDRVKWAGWPRTVIGDDRDLVAEKDVKGTCIFVIGGLTRSEVALIRENIPNISLITTTALITGDKLLNNITSI